MHRNPFLFSLHLRSKAVPSQPHTAIKALRCGKLDEIDMHRLASGDDRALDSLIARHSGSVLHHLQLILRNRRDAEDVLQEVFIRVYQHRLKFRFDSRFTTWLYIIASNLAADLLRWRVRHPAFYQTRESDCGDEIDGIIDPRATPTEEAERDEWFDALELALAHLPSQWRELVFLVSLDGCSRVEASARLGCTLKTVENRLYQARRKLRCEMTGLLGFSPFRASTRSALSKAKYGAQSFHALRGLGQGSGVLKGMSVVCVSTRIEMKGEERL